MLTSTGPRLGMLLNTLQCTGQLESCVEAKKKKITGISKIFKLEAMEEGDWK